MWRFRANNERFVNVIFPAFNHCALTVPNLQRSTDLYELRLDALGIDHGEIVDEWYGSGLAFRDPDNIQLELFHLTGS
jgi:hypothetical protein